MSSAMDIDDMGGGYLEPGGEESEGPSEDYSVGPSTRQRGGGMLGMDLDEEDDEDQDVYQTPTPSKRSGGMLGGDEEDDKASRYVSKLNKHIETVGNFIPNQAKQLIKHVGTFPQYDAEVGQELNKHVREINRMDASLRALNEAQSHIVAQINKTKSEGRKDDMDHIKAKTERLDAQIASVFSDVDDTLRRSQREKSSPMNFVKRVESFRQRGNTALERWDKRVQEQLTKVQADWDLADRLLTQRGAKYDIRQQAMAIQKLRETYDEWKARLRNEVLNEGKRQSGEEAALGDYEYRVSNLTVQREKITSKQRDIKEELSDPSAKPFGDAGKQSVGMISDPSKVEIFEVVPPPDFNILNQVVPEPTLRTVEDEEDEAMFTNGPVPGEKNDDFEDIDFSDLNEGGEFEAGFQGVEDEGGGGGYQGTPKKYDQIQVEVQEALGKFAWTPEALGSESKCVRPVGCVPGVLSLAQKLSYHYMQPYNTNANVMLVHSAGAGKTCTGTLIASTFARAGYTVIFVTKDSLKTEYPETAVLKQCDFNVQQFTTGMGKKLEDWVDPKALKAAKTLPDPKRRKAAMRKLRYEAGKTMMTKMGVRWSRVLNYYQLSNIVSEHVEPGANKGIYETLVKWNGTAEEKAKWKKTGKAYSHDILRNCFIIIDEAHKLVAKAVDMGDKEKGDFRRIRDGLWRSYDRSGVNSVRVLLMTATPIADSPVDMVHLLSLMVPKSMAWDIYDADKTKSEDQFLKQYYVGDKLSPLYELRRMMAGRISYFNFSGDYTRFAKAKQHFVPVELSQDQAAQVVSCFTYKLRRNKQAIAQSKDPKVKGKDPLEDAIQCAMANMNWPESADSLDGYLPPAIRNSTSINQRMKYLTKAGTKIPDLDVIRDSISPTMVAVVKKIESLKERGHEELQQFYSRHAVPNKQKLTYMKQYVFTDITGKANQPWDDFGVNMLAKILEVRYGYVRIETGNETVPDYKGMLVLTGDLKAGPEKEKELERVQNMIARFNSPDNVDGKKIYLVLNSGARKEGISLFHIRYAHIVGLVRTKADLTQAVARGIRMCSQSKMPWEPYKGWDIDVFSYVPSWPKTGKYAKYTKTPLMVVNSLNPKQLRLNKAMDDMQKLMEECAYDKLLLKEMNANGSSRMALEQP